MNMKMLKIILKKCMKPVIYYYAHELECSYIDIFTYVECFNRWK